MTDSRREMIVFLEELLQQVRQGDVAGLAVGIVSSEKLVQAAFFGHCSENPLEAIGVVSLMSRSLVEHLFSESSRPATDAAGTRKK